ncbi:hypothetical protein ACOMHN_022400 [Nucella lapillus]
MIESVQARQRGAYDFESHYDNLCALQDSVPLPAVKANLSSGILDINADRVRAPDWQPIIHTLQINKSLEFVAIRSHFTPPSEADEKRALVIRSKTPSIRSKEITFRLCKALQSCLTVTPTLMFIELTGVPLRERDINVLIKGVMKNKTLVHLSFEMCRIGDKGVEMICKGLKGNNKITSLNLTACSLSARGAELIAKLIKVSAVLVSWLGATCWGKPSQCYLAFASVFLATLAARPAFEGFAEKTRACFQDESLEVDERKSMPAVCPVCPIVPGTVPFPTS